MPTMTKTWTFDIGRANGDSATNVDRTAAWMMWYIKSCLTGQGGYMPATLGDTTAYVTPPVLTAADITNGGHSLGAGTYYYRVTVFVGGVESHSVQEITSTVTGSSQVAFTWGTVTSNTKYRIYRSTVAGFVSGSPVYWETAADATTFTDDGTDAGTGGSPPANNRGFWVCVASCNSVTAVVTAATSSKYGLDLWLANTDVVQAIASTSTAHSWIILRAPALAAGAGTYAPFITLNCCRANQSGTGTAGWVQIYASKTQPSTAAASTTVAPAIPADAWPSVTQMTSTYFGTLFINSHATAAQGHHQNFGITSDGGTWYFTSSPDGTGLVETILVFGTLLNVKGSDQFPYWLWQLGAVNMTAASWTTMIQTSNTTGAFSSTGRSVTGAGSFVVAPIWPAVYSQNIMVAASTPSPDYDGTFFDWPVWCGWCNTISYSTPWGPSQVKGLLADFAFAPESFPMGGVDNSAGSITSMHIGPFWIPSNASPIL